MKKKYIAIILIILLIAVIIVKVVHNSNPKITIFRPKNVNRVVVKNINKYVEESKKEFFKLLKGRRSIAKPELLINYEKSTYKDVDFIYYTSYYFVGGNHYDRDNFSIIFDNISKKELKFKDFFIDNNYKERISNLSLELVKKHLENKGYKYDEDWIKRGVLDSEQYFNFDNNGLNITFPPYKVASWDIGEVTITIDYLHIYDIINKKYLPTNETIEKKEVKERNIVREKGKKYIAFTFDDGPSYLTQNLLDELSKRGVRATFFMLGSRVKEYPNVVIDAYKKGNQICNHSYNHLNFFKISDEQILEEINKTDIAINKLIGKDTTCYRPPYGNIRKKTKQMIKKDFVSWNISTLDWKIRNSKSVYDNIMNKTKDGSVILLHDMYPSTVEGVLRAIDEMKEDNFVFLTMDELRKMYKKAN